MSDTNAMIGIFQDLDIPYEDWTDNPKEFAKRLRDAANKLDIQLKEKNNVLSMEERFKAKSLSNPEFSAQADEFIDSIMDQLNLMEPEVMACVLSRLPEVSQHIARTIRVMSMRQEKQFSKRRVHLMYNRLRKAYETYVGFMKTFRPNDIGNPPNIPARPGNYGNDSISVKEYVFTIDGNDYLNYYTAARILGVEISTYMDLVDMFEGQTELNGHKISYTIFGDDGDE